MASHSAKVSVIEDPRELAVHLLMAIDEHKLLVPQAALRVPFRLKQADRQLCFEMVYGTLRYLPGLERVLRSFCPKPRYPEEIRWLLLISLYQMGFMRIPNYASVNEALGVVRRLKMPGLRGLVNGVLRNAGRKGEALWPETPGTDWLLPPWIWQRFCEQYGEEVVAGWLKDWANRPVTAYWSIEDRGQEGDEPVTGLPHGFRQSSGGQAESLIAQGCYVQNESSQAIAELACRLEPKSVLDLCAAPGGKICYLARFGAAESLLACDISAERLSTLTQNRDRLNLNFEIQMADGTEQHDDAFDLVMIDAPCSGLGIIGRHPEIKLHKTAPAPGQLLALQAGLMTSGFKRVKPGGHLLFTVCSLDKTEIPAKPEGAEFDRTLLEAKFPEGFASIEDERFYISPTNARDGFQGVLLRKPR